MPAAVYSHGAAFIKGPVAYGAEAYAAADKRFLPGQAQHTGLCAGGDYERPGLKFRAGLAEDGLNAAPVLYRARLVQLNLGPLLHGLRKKFIPQFCAADGYKARKILHPGGPGDLTAEGIFFKRGRIFPPFWRMLPR